MRRWNVLPTVSILLELLSTSNFYLAVQVKTACLRTDGQVVFVHSGHTLTVGNMKKLLMANTMEINEEIHTVWMVAPTAENTTRLHEFSDSMQLSMALNLSRINCHDRYKLMKNYKYAVLNDMHEVVRLYEDKLLAVRGNLQDYSINHHNYSTANIPGICNQIETVVHLEMKAFADGIIETMHTSYPAADVQPTAVCCGWYGKYPTDTWGVSRRQIYSQHSID